MSHNQSPLVDAAEASAYIKRFEATSGGVVHRFIGIVNRMW